MSQGCIFGLKRIAVAQDFLFQRPWSGELSPRQMSPFLSSLSTMSVWLTTTRINHLHHQVKIRPLLLSTLSNTWLNMSERRVKNPRLKEGGPLFW